MKGIARTLNNTHRANFFLVLVVFGLCNSIDIEF